MSFRNIYVDVLFAAVLLSLVVFGLSYLQQPAGAGWGHDELLHVQLHFALKNRLKPDFRDAGNLLGVGLRKPFLPYLFSVLVSYAYPRGYAATLLANMIWGWLWLLMIYLVGRRMIGPPAAFAALALLIDSTMFWRIQEHFGNDLPAGVFSTAALALLMGERRFSRFYAWPVLGALLGIALLCKPTAGIFIGPAAVFVFATQMVAAIKNGRWRSVAQIVVGAAVAVGLALWIWSAAYPNFPWELGKLFHQVHAEATTAAKPFLDVNNRTLPADWARALGGARVALLIVGALLAPWALRRPGRRVWLAAFYPTLLYFIRSPQSSSQYMYTMLIVPLWAVTAVAASNARRPWREALVLAIGLVALLSKPGGYHVTAPKDNLGRVPRALTALGERLAGEIDRAPRDGDLFFVNRCALDTAAWDFFLLLPLGDSPHVRFIYFYDARDYADDEAFDRRIRLRSERITYLLSCGGGGATSEFTDAVREARAKMNRHPGEAPWPDQWPRFADVKPETLVTRIGRDKQTWRFWQASSE